MDPLATRLRAERERQGLSVRDISVVTKIREPYIEAIERGRYDVLPAVYVRSFVKTLAGSLGIPDKEVTVLMQRVFEGEEDALRLSRSVPEQQQAGNVIESSVQKASDAVANSVTKASEVVSHSIRSIRQLEPPQFFGNRQRTIMVLAAVGALVLVILFAWLVAPSSTDDNSEAAGADSSGSISESAGNGNVIDVTASVADSMKLTTQVNDTAWLTITTDATHTTQQVLVPGESYAWWAKEKFVLNISNAGGVRFFRDGEPLPLFGRRGETVRSVTITRTDVISSASPSSTLPTIQYPPANTTNAMRETVKPQAAEPKQPSQKRTAPSTQPKPVRKPARQATARQARRQPSPTRRDRRSTMPMITPAPVRPPR